MTTETKEVGIGEEAGKNALKVVVGAIDLKKLANGLVDEVIERALERVVEDTTTELDDMAKAALWPVLEKEAKKLIEEELDLAKILGLES